MNYLYNIENIKHSGSILAKVLEEVSASLITPGITTLQLSNKIDYLIRSFEGATPAFFGYNGFPASACISVNEQVVHSIPTDKIILREGDIVSVDCGVIFKGNYTDACRTIGIGNISKEKQNIIRVAKEALDCGINALVPGSKVRDVSYQIQRHTEKNGFNVSLDFCGHGIGTILHDEPLIPNFGPPNTGPNFEVGLCYAIEPVIYDYRPELQLGEDSWTVYSTNGCLSAHFEDTVLLDETGPIILTRLERA